MEQQRRTPVRGRREDILSRMPGGAFCYELREGAPGPVTFISEGMLQLLECTERQFRQEYGGEIRRLLCPLGAQPPARACDQGRKPDNFSCRIRTRGGRLRWLTVSRRVCRDEDGVLRAYVTAVDSTAEHEATERLQQEREDYRRRAQNDLLTGVYNKVTAERLVEKLLDSGLGGALYLVDVDDFKTVNDTFGHLCGDEALAGVSGCLRGALRHGDVVGRVGGDEFLLYLPGVDSVEAARSAGLKVLEALEQLSVGPQGRGRLSVSIGGVLCDQTLQEYRSAYRRADEALYLAKARGKNCLELWRPDGGKIFSPRAQKAGGCQGAGV